MKHKLLSIILLALSTNIFAQNYVIDADRNYRDDVKTVLLYPTGFSLDKPIIMLNNDMEEALHLEFDILSAEAPYLYYTIVHCDNKWQPSDIQKNEYIEGFFQNEIKNYEFSLNTFIDYVHYDLLFPTSDMMPKISGNYLIVVTGENENDVYFTRRFFVAEDYSLISATMPRYPYDMSLGTKQQSIDLEISYPDMFNNRPDQYSFVTIQQNGRWDNASVGLKPTYSYPEKLTYNNNPKTVFNSDNQYLRINTSNFNNRPEKTATVYREEEGYVVTLYHDTKRNTVAYTDEGDIHGEMNIYLERTNLDPNKEADYARVDFSLDWPEEMPGQDVYILGAITDWRLDDNSKMNYDPEEKCYKKGLWLKQGYYDYMYIVKDRETGIATLEPVNGNFWETNNIYTIYVYLHDQTQNYDRLIGYTMIKSH